MAREGAASYQAPERGAGEAGAFADGARSQEARRGSGDRFRAGWGGGHAKAPWLGVAISRLRIVSEPGGEDVVRSVVEQSA